MKQPVETLVRYIRKALCVTNVDHSIKLFNSAVWVSCTVRQRLSFALPKKAMTTNVFWSQLQ